MDCKDELITIEEIQSGFTGDKLKQLNGRLNSPLWAIDVSALAQMYHNYERQIFLAN